MDADCPFFMCMGMDKFTILLYNDMEYQINNLILGGMRMSDIKDLRNPTLQLRLSPELNERLERVVSMYGVTRGEIARMALAQYVGQITGSIDQMIKSAEVQSQSIDYEKLAKILGPMIVDSVAKSERPEA